MGTPKHLKPYARTTIDCEIEIKGEMLKKHLYDRAHVGAHHAVKRLQEALAGAVSGAFYEGIIMQTRRCELGHSTRTTGMAVIGLKEILGAVVDDAVRCMDSAMEAGEGEQ